MITGKNYIGKTLSNKNSDTFQAYDALNFKMLDQEFYSATEEEVNAAVKLSSTAFNEYKNFSGDKKAEFLDLIAEEILELGDELIETAMLETALPQARLIGERGRTVGQ